ncbi:MAG: hypothetical protein R2853_03505 [Thermomicrobiales bacterium]
MTIIRSRRLFLIPLTPEALTALMKHDRPAAEHALNGRFPPAELVPPLMADALEYFLNIATAGPQAPPGVLVLMSP